MSRVGKLPIVIPADVQVNIKDGKIAIKGKLGELSAPLNDNVKVSIEDGHVNVQPVNDSKESRAMWGTLRNNINNMVKGVFKGFEIRLVIFGVGYRAACDGKYLTLSLGYSHEIKYAIPQSVSIKCEKPTLLVISGSDRQLVGQVAGELMKLRPVEPYKGKGIYIEGSYVRRKEGKKK
jgi:large subunit ribosomal protein L6